VPVAFVLVVASKVRFVTKVLSKADLKVDEEDDQMLLRSFERFQIGLASKFTQAILQLLVTIRLSLIDCS